MESFIQSYLFYASMLGVTIYLCKESVTYYKKYVLEKSYSSIVQMIDSQFNTLSLIFDKEKVMYIKDKIINTNDEFKKYKIEYPEWKKRVKESVDEIFDLFDEYYRI